MVASSASGVLLAASLGLAEGPDDGSSPSLAENPKIFGAQCCATLQIPASAFVPRSSGVTYAYDSVGYVYVTSNGPLADEQLWAPVQLPTGVQILSVELFYFDANPSTDMTATLRSYSGGSPTSGAPAQSDVVSASSSGSSGYGYSTAATSYTVRNDVESNPAAAQLAILVSTPQANSNFRFKAVGVQWKRQVSPAPATATFNDVPVGHPQFQFVEALSSAGITGGCGPAVFCPTNPVTRGQMAVFLSIALGLHWPD